MELNEALFWTVLLVTYGISVYLVAYHHGWIEGHKKGWHFGERHGRRFTSSETQLRQRTRLGSRQ